MHCFRQYLVAIGLLFFTTLPSWAQEAAQTRVLFLGNSVFYYEGGVYQSFEGFCRADGLDCQAVSQRTAPENPHGVEFLGHGRIPLSLPEVAADEQIHNLIRAGRFDFVVLEARRHGYLMPAWVPRPAELNLGESIPYQQNLDALGRLHRTIVESNAQTVLYMHPGHHVLPDWKQPIAQIYRRLQADLQAMEINSQCHDVLLVPASLLWVDAVNRFGVEAWFANSNHGTALARYASGCMLYTYLSGSDPRQTAFRELPRPWDIMMDTPTDSMEKDMDAWIKNQVWLYYSTRQR